MVASEIHHRADQPAVDQSADFYFYTTVLLVFIVILLQVLRYMDSTQQEMMRKIKKETKRQAKIQKVNDEMEN